MKEKSDQTKSARVFSRRKISLNSADDSRISFIFENGISEAGLYKIVTSDSLYHEEDGHLIHVRPQKPVNGKHSFFIVHQNSSRVAGQNITLIINPRDEYGNQIEGEGIVLSHFKVEY